MSSLHPFLVAAAAFLVFLPGTAQAAPTRFVSPNYGVESVIFGGTGTLRSSEASIPPVITDGPAVSDITTTSVTVSWKTDKPSNSILVVGTSSGDYPIQTGQVTQTTYTDHKVALGQLKKGTSYFYKVRSVDVAGNIVESAEKTFATDPGDVTAPRVLSGPTVANTSATSVLVTWETDEISSTTVEYGLRAVNENSVGPADELTQFHQVAIPGLQAAQTYQLRVRSKDAADNVYVGTPVQFTTLNAPAITNVRITDVTLTSALVQWETTSPSTSLVSYGTASGSYTQKVEDLSSTQNHLVRLSGLVSGTVYYLRLSGQDAAGNRISSDEYTVKTVVLPVIANFRVTATTSDSVTLEWDSSSDIDEFVKYAVTNAPDKTLIGKVKATGNDKLVAKHAMTIDSLESGAEYDTSVVGKDVFGNQAISQSLHFRTLDDSTPPEIKDLKTDTTVDLGSKQTVQVLVSFGLSEPGKVYLVYGEQASGKFDQRVDTDAGYSTNKLLVLAGLQAGQSYQFKIVARDKAGNVTESPEYLVLAPVQQASLLDLIFKQLRDNFGPLAQLGGK